MTGRLMLISVKDTGTNRLLVILFTCTTSIKCENWKTERYMNLHSSLESSFVWICYSETGQTEGVKRGGRWVWAKMVRNIFFSDQDEWKQKEQCFRWYQGYAGSVHTNYFVPRAFLKLKHSRTSCWSDTDIHRWVCV